MDRRRIRMLEIGSFEAKNRLPELLRKAKAGERVLITNRHEPMAMLVPPILEQPDASAAIDALLALGEQHMLHLEPGETLASLINAGRA